MSIKDPRQDLQPDLRRQLIASTKLILTNYFLPQDKDFGPLNGLIGADYRLELQNVEVADFPSLGVVVWGESTHSATPLRITVKLRRTAPREYLGAPDITLSNKASIKANTTQLHDILEEQIAALQQSEQGEVSFDLLIVAKEMDVLPDLGRNEVQAYTRLTELKIPTLCCIYPPPTFYEISPDSIDGHTIVMTLFEHNLIPLSAIEEVLNPEFDRFGQLFDTLARMHINDFCHGDAHLKNFADKAGQEIYVTVIDPEASADFKSLSVGKRVIPNHLYRYLDDPDNAPENRAELINLLRTEMMLDDVATIVADLSPDQKGVGYDEIESERKAYAWDVIESRYISVLENAGKLADRMRERIFDDFNHYWARTS